MAEDFFVVQSIKGKSMDDITRNLEIIDEFNNLLKKIEGGRIYGKEVNINSTYELVVASYYIGKSEELDRRIKESNYEI